MEAPDLTSRERPARERATTAQSQAGWPAEPPSPRRPVKIVTVIVIVLNNLIVIVIVKRRGLDLPVDGQAEARGFAGDALFGALPLPRDEAPGTPHEPFHGPQGIPRQESCLGSASPDIAKRAIKLRLPKRRKRHRAKGTQDRKQMPLDFKGL